MKYRNPDHSRPGSVSLLPFIILLFLPVSMQAQVRQYSRMVEWGESRPRAIYRDSTVVFSPEFRHLYFEGAGYPDQELNFPWFSEQIPLDASSVVDSIRLENTVYSELTAEELMGITGLDQLKEQIVFNHTTVYQRGNPLIRIDLLPLRKNRLTGRIEKLTAFTLHAFERQVAATTGNSLPYASASVLATGKWYKIKIQKNGIYKLTYEDLEKIGLSNPGDIRVYGNGGQQLPLMNADPRPDDLLENAIYMEKGGDDVFNKGDYILFYGKGVVSWQYNADNEFFSQKLNGYSEAAYYFLTCDLGPGKRIQAVAQASGTVTHTVTAYNDYDYYEKNLINYTKSGRQWFSNKISGSFDTTFVFTGLITSEPVRLMVNVASRSSSDKFFSIRGNDVNLGYIMVDRVTLNSFTGIQANQKSGLFTLSASSDQVNVIVSYDKTDYSDIGWLDYITVNVRRNLTFNNNILYFRDIQSTGTGNIARFSISGATEKLRVWDITNPCNAFRVESSLNGSILSYTAATDSLREFVAFLSDAAFPKPVTEASDVGLVENQNLHGAAIPQMLIVTHPLFLQQADSLAEFHRTKDNMSVLVTTTNQVYNEFSSGAPDVSAIRDLARMLYRRAGSDDQRPRYLLLFGDGSYNNHMQVSGNPNFIPTYQSQSSLNVANSYVSDDFYGLLDDNEGGSDNMYIWPLDLGLGRLPVKKVEEARGILNKIIGYNKAENMRDWRNKILFVGDDGEHNEGIIHMSQADALAESLSVSYPGFIIKKVYLDAYNQISTSTGARYPDVNQAIYDNVHKGVLIFNYTGHGNEKGLAEEQIITREQLSAYTNFDNLPLFVTATCEFSRFDDLAVDESGTMNEQTSAGETSLRNPNGGSIALLTTTRLVYSLDNYTLNSYFYQFVFKRDATGQYYRMGDVIRFAKNAISYDSNKLNFILLGDPALKLAIPDHIVLTDSLNGMHVVESLDTLKAFTEVTLKGHIADLENNKMTAFNGVIYPSVFDKALKVTTLGNDDKEKTMDFMVQDNLIYKGKANVKNGEFSFSFIVPKDISYNMGHGKICYYAQDSVEDASGYFSDFVVGGTSPYIIADENGPLIDLYINDENFISGGITDRNPQIYALISDYSGINTSANGIGHDIVGIMDGDATKPLILNDYYEADLGDYRNGSLRYSLNGLEVGMHTLKMRVWDIFNNPSEATIDFEVLDKEELVLQHVYNYPNPAQSFTCFQFEHNKAGVELKVTIDIFDLSGRKIRMLEQMLYAEGYHSSPIEWDLKDQNGNAVRSGLYPYRIRVEDPSGLLTDGFQKLLISRW